MPPLPPYKEYNGLHSIWVGARGLKVALSMPIPTIILAILFTRGGGTIEALKANKVCPQNFV